MKNQLINLTQRAASIFKVNFTSRMGLMKRERKINVYDGMDYVRFSSLELCSSEIYDRGLLGSVAELGVYKGEFAERISAAFPDRTFYLFDTFAGFDAKDISVDQQDGFSTGKQDFSDTSVKTVLKRINHPCECIVKQGYFPATAAGVDDIFVFVSIDTDLYQPIYEGLKFFYPRLQKGGSIFVHDYNNDEYKGSKQAVRDFSREFGVGFFPLSDCAGSAVITK